MNRTVLVVSDSLTVALTKPTIFIGLSYADQQLQFTQNASNVRPTTWANVKCVYAREALFRYYLV